MYIQIFTFWFAVQPVFGQIYTTYSYRAKYAGTSGVYCNKFYASESKLKCFDGISSYFDLSNFDKLKGESLENIGRNSKKHFCKILNDFRIIEK